MRRARVLRIRRTRGAGLIFGVLYTLMAALLAAGLLARCAVEVRALHRDAAQLAALALAEAGAELALADTAERVDRRLGRGQVKAIATHCGDRVTVASRGAIRSATGNEVAVVVRVIARRSGDALVREHWEQSPAPTEAAQ